LVAGTPAGASAAVSKSTNSSMSPIGTNRHATVTLMDSLAGLTASGADTRKPKAILNLYG